MISLNDDQARAAEHLTGPVLVTAGAGSGKTRMLTERFANAVVPGRLDGWDAVELGSVVAITYTEKAAAEIAERVRAEIGRTPFSRLDGAEDLWISTIHGFCARILRRTPFEAGVDPLFAVADTLKVGRFRERAFGEALARLDREGSSVRELLDAYGEDQVFLAVLEISRQLSVGGLEADSVEVANPATLAELLSEARELFEDGTSVCDIEYSGRSTTHLEHAESCRALVEECGGLSTLEHSERGALERLRQMAERYEPIRRLAGFEELRADMCARKLRLLRRTAAAIVAPYEQTMIDLVSAYRMTFSQLKTAAGVLDFEDLQITAVRLLEGRPDVAARYNERFKVVMIDEFQDTDALQLELMERIAGENLCTVGDEMQSIYRFRGADIEVYRRHQEEMRSRGALSVELAVNYRSHPQIIGFVNAVFGSSEYGKNNALALRPVPEGRPSELPDEVIGAETRVEVLLVDSGAVGSAAGRSREAAELAERLAGIVERGTDPGDVAILLRAYTDAHVYMEALSRRGVPAVIVGGSRFFGLEETAVMRALTRVIANVTDDAALGVLLASEFASISDDGLLRMRLGQEGTRISLWEAICTRGDSLCRADAEALGRLRRVLESALTRVGCEPLGDVLLRAVEEVGYDLRLIRRGSLGRDAFANVAKFARRAAEFEAMEGSGPAGFAAYLDDKERLNDLEAPESGADGTTGAVRIMSIHASKGLEFAVVAVPDIGRQARGNAGIVRTERHEDAVHLALKTPRGDEERRSTADSERFSALDEADKEAEEQGAERLFYVALTRARDVLLVSASGILNPNTRPASKSDLVKLARVLGRDVPVGGPCDEVVSVGDGSSCRLRIVVAAGEAAEHSTQADVTDDLDPLPIGEPLGVSGSSARPPMTVSYTQLSEFGTCPRHFRIRRLLGAAPPRPAGSGHEPKRFGTALHSVLRLVSPAGELPDAPRIDAIARFFELDGDESRRMADAAARYAGSEVARRAASADVTFHEAPLSLSIEGDRFFVAGSIDLYARCGDSGLIVDYKSGIAGAPENLPERYRLQAECYALAALRAGCRAVEVVFVRPEVVRDGQMESVTYQYASTDAEGIESRLADRYHEIEAAVSSGDFPPHPGTACAVCDVPSRLCEFRGRKEGGT